jgi:TPR repeat protein
MRHLLLTASALAATIAVGQSGQLGELIRRANNNDAKALYNLAYLYDIGYDSIPVDSAMSTNLYTKSANLGYAPAQSYLGFRYYNGEYVAKDVAKGIEWIERAAMAGDAKAANNMGWLLINSNEIEHDYAKAAYWFEKAADGGLPAGMAQLADLYREGKGVNADTIKATELYTHAIEAGLHDAELKLLNMNMSAYMRMTPRQSYLTGVYYYTHSAPTIGVTLLGMAAEQGECDALALLSYHLAHEQDYSSNPNSVLNGFYEAAEGGNAAAMFMIAELLEFSPDALTEAGNTKNAQEWYTLAAQKGVIDAETAEHSLFSPADAYDMPTLLDTLKSNY